MLVLFWAFVLDLLLGDPEYPLHPVRIIGRVVSLLESLLRRAGMAGMTGGALLAVSVLISFTGAYLGLRFALHHVHPRLAVAFDTFVVYSCIAFKDLLRHGGLIADALERGDFSEARVEVQKIVGRDASRLDASGIARAAVESVAENFVDGLLSPFFWYITGCALSSFAGLPTCTGGVLGIFIFRVVNTLDSMVGHRSEQYLRFGCFAARLDDVMNFFPARLSVPIISLSAGMCGLNAVHAVEIAWRDRLKHPSPNAGHAESCVAGALAIRLGGPAVYSGGVVKKPWIGDGTADISHEHIRKCCVLILCSGLVALSLALLFLLWLQ